MSYCYVTLLFSPKGKCDYLEGVLLTGLGLRKQQVKYPLKCLVTPDVSEENRKIILEVWDEIIEVPYISPVESSGILMSKNYFNPKYFENNNPWLKVYTKLHIFNSEILPYDKVLFVDSDLIPLKDFDNIFENYDTPAGWLELVFRNPNNTYRITWGKHFLKDNQIIPEILTNIEISPQTVNAGLLLIKPNYKQFMEMIEEIKNPVELKAMDLDGKIKDFYWCPEQAYLTKKFSGKWHYLNHYYNSWGYHNDNCKSLHMAGLYYNINGKKVYAKTWQIQRKTSDIFNVKTNEIAEWGIEKYPKLEKILLKNLKII